MGCSSITMGKDIPQVDMSSSKIGGNTKRRGGGDRTPVSSRHDRKSKGKR